MNLCLMNVSLLLGIHLSDKSKNKTITANHVQAEIAFFLVSDEDEEIHGDI